MKCTHEHARTQIRRLHACGSNTGITFHALSELGDLHTKHITHGRSQEQISNNQSDTPLYCLMSLVCIIQDRSACLHRPLGG